ncbi:hypothetical protein HYQ44_014632 [Verticillium longisporum]|nr:hypothetical protein HYQ44_014632 [Verticillium longisporum]
MLRGFKREARFPLHPNCGTMSPVWPLATALSVPTQQQRDPSPCIETPNSHRARSSRAQDWRFRYVSPFSSRGMTRGPH